MSKLNAAITLTMGAHCSADWGRILAHDVVRLIAKKYPDIEIARVWEVWDPGTETVTPLPQDPAAYYAEIDAEDDV